MVAPDPGGARGGSPWRGPRGEWVVSHPAQAKEVLADPDRFSSARVPGDLPLLLSDPPLHTRLRGRLRPALEDSVARLGRDGVLVLVQRVARALPVDSEVDGV